MGPLRCTYLYILHGNVNNQITFSVLYLLYKVLACPRHCAERRAPLEPEGAQLPHQPLLSWGFWVRVGHSSLRLQGHQHWAW